MPDGGKYKDISEEPLTEAERRQAHRILSDPLNFPSRFTIWLDNRYYQDAPPEVGVAPPPCEVAVNNSIPSITPPTGTPATTYTADPGTWTSGSTPTYTYQWQVRFSGIWYDAPGATAQEWTPNDNDADFPPDGITVFQQIRVGVIAHDDCGASLVAYSDLQGLGAD